MNCIIQKLRELGYDTVSESFYAKIQEWKSWYQGEVLNFHRYKEKNGRATLWHTRFTLGMAKKIAEDWANLLMNEKVAITLEGEAEQTFIDEVFTRNNFAVKCNELQEMAFALGTVAIIPRVTGMKAVNGEALAGSAEGIVMDYVTVEHIFPLAWQNGIITECAFSSESTLGEDTYVYLQLHTKGADGFYQIQNRIYHKVSESLTELPLASVKGFENIPQIVYTQSSERQFVVDRPNIANNIDFSIPLGMAVFANAIDVLKGVDIAFDSYVNEFQLGKKRIMIKPSATEYIDGEAAFDASNSLFYVLPEDVSDGSIINQIDMSLRSGEHNTGIQDMLNLLSSKCGFGEHHYKFERGGVSTATQVISEHSSKFRTIKKHEIVLESVLLELCRILLRLGNSAMGLHLDENVEISIDFDDSIIEDESADFARDMQLLNAGIMNDWEFRMKWMNEDEETAKAALPGMDQLAGAELGIE